MRGFSGNPRITKPPHPGPLPPQGARGQSQEIAEHSLWNVGRPFWADVPGNGDRHKDDGLKGRPTKGFEIQWVTLRDH